MGEFERTFKIWKKIMTINDTHKIIKNYNEEKFEADPMIEIMVRKGLLTKVPAKEGGYEAGKGKAGAQDDREEVAGITARRQ